MTVNAAGRRAATGADRAPEIIARGDAFPCRLESNRKTLEAFRHFAHAQGITATKLSPDDLFPKEMRASVRV